MPTYTVVVHKDGLVKLMTAAQLEQRSQTAKQETEVGKFTAENTSEAWRLLVQENPVIDANTHRIMVQVGQDVAADQQRRELHQSIMEEAVGNLQVPQGSDPEAYSDEAHIDRGEMESPDARAERKQAEENMKSRSVDNPEPGRFREPRQPMPPSGQQEPGMKGRGSNQNPAGAQDSGYPDAGGTGTAGQPSPQGPNEPDQ